MTMGMGQGSLGELSVRLTVDKKDFQKGIDEVKGGLDRIKETGRSMQQAGASLLAISAPITGLIGAGVKVFASYEQGMARVKAVSGATEEQFEALGNVAREMGRTTVFTASQSADALGFMAMAGMEATAMVGALPSVLQLASAGQLDLARSADIVTNVMAGYGLEVEDLARANDVLVTGFTSANTDLSQLGEAFKYAGPVAKSAGLSFEDTAAALALMGNAGIQGSMAGTSLRGAMTRLLNPSAKAKAIIKQLGLNAVDASGKIRPMDEIIGQLEKSGITAGQAMEVFGLRAGPAMLALVEQGSGALRDLRTEMENSGGTADRIAKTQLDTLQGAITLLKSALEGAAIEIGTAVAPALTEFAKRLAPIVSQIGEWISRNPKLIRTIGIVALSMTVLGAALMGVGTGLLLIAPLLPAVGGAFALLLGPIGLLVAALAGLGVAWQRDLFGLQSRVKDAVSRVSDTFTLAREQWGMGLFKSVLYAASEFPAGLSDRLRPVTTVMQNAIDKFAAPLETAKGHLDTFVGAVEVGVKRFVDIWQATADSGAGFVARFAWSLEFAGLAVDKFLGSGKKATDVAKQLGAGLNELSVIVKPFTDLYVSYIKEIGLGARDAVRSFRYLRDNGASVTEALKGSFKSFIGGWKDFVSEGIIHNDKLHASFDRLKTVGTNLFTNLKETAVPRLEAFAEGVKDFFNRAITYVQENGPALFERITGVVMKVADWLIANGPSFIEKGRQFVSNLISGALDWLTTNGASLIEGFNNLVQKAVDWLTSDQARQLLIGGATFLLTRFIGFWPVMLVQFGPQIVSAISKMLPPLLQGLADMLPPLVKAAGVMLRELVGNMAVLLRDLIPEIGKTLRELTPVLAESLRTVVSAIGPVIRELIPVIIDLIVIILREGIPLVGLVIKELGLLMGAILKELPSLLWVIIRDVGTIIPQMLIKALGEQLGPLGQKMGDIFILIRDFFFGLPGRVFGAIVSAVAIIFARFKSAIMGGRTLVSEGTRDIFLGIKSFFTGLPGRLIGAIVQMGKDVFSAVRDALPSLGDIRNMLTDRIKGAWEGSKNTLSNLNPANWRIPGFQFGGVMQQTGMALVGEGGPELVHLPGGSRVFSHEDSMDMLGSSNGGGIHVTQNFYGPTSPSEQARQQERAMRRLALDQGVRL